VELTYIKKLNPHSHEGTITKDFIVAMKNKDVVSKAALSSLKAAITTEEKPSYETLMKSR